MSLCTTSPLQEHVEHLQEVFQVLHQHQPLAKRSKCSFAQQQMEYRGHIISVDGVSTGASKTQAMQQWPTPTNVAKLQVFLGLTGYCRCFVKNYGVLAKPLTNLLKKKGFQWSEETTRAFVQLKKAMSEDHRSLCHLDQQL